MTEATHRQDVTREAAAWIARLDAGELTADDLIALRDWAAQSPAHMRELERLGEAWRDLDVLAALNGLLAKPHSELRSWRRPLAVAAGIAMVATVAAMVFMYSPSPEPVKLTAAYTTDIGELTKLEPGEGSVIDLNTDSRMAVAFSDSQRRVELTQGEAFFNVEASDDRPFVVATGFGDVVVTGTAFLVRVDDTRLEVVVQEGQVRVQEPAAAGLEPSLLASIGAGEVATIDGVGGSTINVIDPERIDRKLDWRDGMLTFDGDSLDQVVREVSRYTSVKIVIEDALLRERRIGGYFKVGEVEDLLGTLQSDFDVQVDRVGEHEVRLTSRAN